MPANEIAKVEQSAYKVWVIHSKYTVDRRSHRQHFQKQNAEFQNYRLFALLTINPINSLGISFVFGAVRIGMCVVYFSLSMSVDGDVSA